MLTSLLQADAPHGMEAPVQLHGMYPDAAAASGVCLSVTARILSRPVAPGRTSHAIPRYIHH